MRTAILLLVAVAASACAPPGDDQDAAAPAPERPAWCVHNDRVQTEIAFQAELEAKHGPTVTDWPDDDLDRLVQSIDDQTAAAGRLWDAAPPDYDWSDVRRVCGPTTSPAKLTSSAATTRVRSSTTTRGVPRTTTVPTTTTTAAIPANPGNAVSCADFEDWAEAQAWYDTYAPHYGDVALIDINNNGVACEKLLPEGVTVEEVAATVTTAATVTSTTAGPATTQRTTTTRPAPARSPFTDAERDFLNDALLLLGQSGGGFYSNGLDTTGDGRVDTAWDDPAAASYIADARQAISNARNTCKRIKDMMAETERIKDMMAETGWTAEEILLDAYNSGLMDEAAYISGVLAVAHLC